MSQGPDELARRVDRLERWLLRLIAAGALTGLVAGSFLPWFRAERNGEESIGRLGLVLFQGLSHPGDLAAEGLLFFVYFLVFDVTTILAACLVVHATTRSRRPTWIDTGCVVLLGGCLLGAWVLTIGAQSQTADPDADLTAMHWSALLVWSAGACATTWVLRRTAAGTLPPPGPPGERGPSGEPD